MTMGTRQALQALNSVAPLTGQALDSLTLLKQSQADCLPALIEALGLSIIIHPGVFSPKHFRGWETFTRNFPRFEGQRILEIGCGTGITALYLAKNGAEYVVAVDISEAAVANTEANMHGNGVANMEVRISDVFSNVDANERFDIIYWNLPFIYVPASYEPASILERSLFDPGYVTTERFLAQATRFLKQGGRLVVGLGDFADLERFFSLTDRYGYRWRCLAREKSMEINPVEFHLYELEPIAERRGMVFWAMPFTGQDYRTICDHRLELRSKASARRLELLEQFVGIEEEEPFNNHSYPPLFIAEKDFQLLETADIVVCDFSGPSLGRDCELVFAREKLQKRIVAIVPDPHVQNHPYLRLFSDYVVRSEEEALDLCQKLLALPIRGPAAELTRDQKNGIDQWVRKRACRPGARRLLKQLTPTELRRRWKNLFETEVTKAWQWAFHPVPRTIRVNTLKTTAEHFLEIADNYGWRVERAAISPFVFRLPAGRLSVSPGNTAEHDQGFFYVQDVASLLPAIGLDPQPGDMVLELGAAPGSKSTQMAQMMQNRGCIIAIDISQPRLEILKRNVQRMEAAIVQPTLGDGTRLGPEFRSRFDRVLVDGPCSCEGIFRYKPHKLFEWSLSQMRRNASTLELLLRNGFEALRPGGTLVYSTCTYAPEENEVIIDRALNRFPSAHLLPVPCVGLRCVPGKSRWEDAALHPSLTQTRRCYPWHNNSLGFFVAKMERAKCLSNQSNR